MNVAQTMQAAVQELQSGNLKQAAELLEQVVEFQPRHAGAWQLLGVIAFQRNHNDLALELMRRSIGLAPDLPDFHNNLGNVLAKMKRLEEAVKCFERAIELRPDHVEARTNLGAALEALWRLDEAVARQCEAIRLRPDHVNAHINFGSALRKLGNLEEAESAYRQAAYLQQTSADAHNGLGVVLQEQEKITDAIGCFDRAIELRPDFADAIQNRVIAYMLAGNTEIGWAAFEGTGGWSKLQKFSSPQPEWNGTELHGRSILLRADQGLGDTLQFIRYIPMVLECGGKVILECQAPLQKLLQGFAGTSAVLARGEPLPDFQVQALLTSMPRIFRTSLNSIPAVVPYLRADALLIQQWKKRLEKPHGLKVGIAWHADLRHRGAEFRCIPLAAFEPLTQIEGIQLISLQKGPGSEQIRDGRFSVVDLGGGFDEDSGPFMDTAAIMMNLDLVISNDSAIAHLAGALGVPVWLALPVGPDCRWLLCKQDTAWYPTMRLYRQKQRWQWQDVFGQMADDLKRKLR
jgi:tetratricopeptide (TPR) repeat protein